MPTPWLCMEDISQTAILKNGIIDVLNKLSSTDLATIASHYSLNDLTYEGKLIMQQ